MCLTFVAWVCRRILIRGYTKKNQALDIAGVMDVLKVKTADLVTHDIGNMVGYALVAQFPQRITRWVAIDAPLPGIGNWDSILRSPLLWHFNFRGPDEERLVRGRERIYLDRFYNELSADPKAIDTKRATTMPRFTPNRMPCTTPLSSLARFLKTLPITRRCWLKEANLRCRCLASEARSLSAPGWRMSCGLSRLTSAAGIVPHSGHWIMEENPEATVKIVTEFLAK